MYYIRKHVSLFLYSGRVFFTLQRAPVIERVAKMIKQNHEATYKDNREELKPVHIGDYSRRFRRQFVAENGDCRTFCDSRRFR